MLIKVFSLNPLRSWPLRRDTAFHSSELLLELLSTSHRHFFSVRHMRWWTISSAFLPHPLLLAAGVLFPPPLLSNLKVVRKIKLYYKDEKHCVLRFWNLCVSAWIPASVVQVKWLVLYLWIELNSHLNTFLNKLSILLLTPIPQIGSCYERRMTGRWENSGWIPMSCRRVGNMFGLANIYNIIL